MTEEEWLACTEPQKMLVFLRGAASDRSLSLFICACCRRIWHLLTPGRSSKAVEIAERFADLNDKDLSLDDIFDDLCLATMDCEIESENLMASATTADDEARTSATFAALKSITYTSEKSAEDASSNAISAVYHAATAAAAPSAAAARVDERGKQALLLGDIFGNPFRPSGIDPQWLRWNDGTVIRLAQTAYDERILPAGKLDNTRLLILADALEEAGCTDEHILMHLRSRGEHYRGCWVIDLLLGKR